MIEHKIREPPRKGDGRSGYFNKIILTEDNKKAIKTQYEEYIKNNKDDKNNLEDIFTHNIKKTIDTINKFIDDIISKIAANNNNIKEADLLLKSKSELIELLDKDDFNLLNKLNELISTLLSIHNLHRYRLDMESFVDKLIDLFKLVNNIKQIGPDGIIVIPDKSKVIKLYNQYNSASRDLVDNKMFKLRESIKKEYKEREQKAIKAIKAIKEKKILFI
jgi:hypothetical protein